MRILLTIWGYGRVGLLAAAPDQGLAHSYRYYVGLAILLVLMAVALVKAFRMWEEIHDVEQPDSKADLLETFEEVHAAGELDDLEFERVRRSLTGTVADETGRSAQVDREAESSDGS